MTHSRGSSASPDTPERIVSAAAVGRLRTIDLSGANGRVAPGSCYLRDTPALNQHSGSQPDLFVSWTAVDAGTRTLDVILYFHGFAVDGEREALLSDFVDVSGLDPMKGGESLADRKRPTIAIVPRGNASPTRSPSTPYWPYSFPAVANGGATRLISDVLQSFSSASQPISGIAGALQLGRLIVMGHSGGRTGVIEVLKDRDHPPDEVYLFDALYGDPGSALSDWIAGVIGNSSRHQRMWIGHLDGTAAISNRVRELCAAAIGRAPSGQQADLHERLRVVAVEGSHMGVPRRYARALLAVDDATPAVTDASAD